MVIWVFRCLSNLVFPIGLVFILTGPILDTGAAAQEPTRAGQPDAARTSALQDLVGTLRDDAARQALIDQIETLVEAREGVDAADQPPAPEGLTDRVRTAVSGRIEAIVQHLNAIGSLIGRAPNRLDQLSHEARKPENLRRWGEIVLKIFAALATGLLGEWLTYRLLKRLWPNRTGDPTGFLARHLMAMGRTTREILPVGIFALVTYLMVPVTEPPAEARVLILAAVNAYLAVRTFLALSRFFFAPDRPELRLLRLEADNAYTGYVWTGRLATVGICGIILAETALLLGASQGSHGLLLKLTGLVLTAMAVTLAIKRKEAVAAWIRGGAVGDNTTDPDTWTLFRSRLAKLWHVATVVFLIVLFATWVLDIPGGFEYLARASSASLLVIAIAIGLNRVISRALARPLPQRPAPSAGLIPLRGRLERYAPAIGVVLRAVTYLVAALSVLQFWGLPTLVWLASEHGTTLLARTLTIAVISGAAFVIWEALSLVIEQTLQKRATDAGGPRSARLLTLLPLLRNVARVVLLVMVTLIALSELNIDIGPLLAGAGVVGLAIGFGAQALVRDIITGAFILIEDSLAVGDWVEIGSHSGTVEAMSIRTVTLRDLHGTVHIIPFGEVTSVLNYNRAFGNAVLDVGVAYRENLDEVMAILEEIGRELSSDPSFGPALLGPLEIAGVNNLADSAVEIRVSVKTRPMKQWGVRREMLKRIKKTFDERGIEIPFPHRTLHIAADKSDQAPPVPVLHQPAQS